MSAEVLVRHAADARGTLLGVAAAPLSFACPYGTWDLSSSQAAANAGYTAASAVAPEGGRFAIDRAGIFCGDTITTFWLMLSVPCRIASRMAGRAWRFRHLVRDALRGAVHPSNASAGRGADA
jgi:hypothetical protein